MYYSFKIATVVVKEIKRNTFFFDDHQQEMFNIHFVHSRGAKLSGFFFAAIDNCKYVKQMLQYLNFEGSHYLKLHEAMHLSSSIQSHLL